MRYLRPLVTLFLLASWGQGVWARAEQQTILFEQNRGQFVDEIDFIARGQNYLLALGTSPIIEIQKPYSLLGPQKPSTASETPQSQYYTAQRLQLNFIGSNSDSVASGLQPSKRKTHYLFGESEKNIADAAHFRRVRYTALYDHIDIEYYYRDGFPEYDLLIQPGGSLDDVNIRYTGAEAMRIGDDGALLFTLGDTEISHPQPVAYQVINGEKQAVEASFVLQGDQLRFKVGAYDINETLVVDPQIVFLAEYGGNGIDVAEKVGHDTDGNVYLITRSSSTSLASAGAYLSDNPFQRSLASYNTPIGNAGVAILKVATAILITKLSPDLSEVIYSTYFYPSNTESFSGTGPLMRAAVSDSGHVGFGFRASLGASGLPLMNEVQGYDAQRPSMYLAMLNSSGSGLQYATFIQFGNNGGFGSELTALDITPTGQMVVVAALRSFSDLPLVNALPGHDCNSETAGLYDNYIAMFNNNGGLRFASCLGGLDGVSANFRERLTAIYAPNDSEIYVAGYSSSPSYPLVNPFQDSLSQPDARDGVISVIDPVNAEIKYSSYFGAERPGFVVGNRFRRDVFNLTDITADQGGNIIFSAYTNILYLPTANAAFGNITTPSSSYGINREDRSFYDSYLAKLNPDSNELVFATYLGGTQAEISQTSLNTDSQDNIYLMGETHSEDFPLIGSNLDIGRFERYNYLAKFTTDGKLAFSGFLGGSDRIESVFTRSGGFDVLSDDSVVIASNYSTSPLLGNDEYGASDHLGQQIHLFMLDQSSDIDSDSDGVVDTLDAFPNDADEWRDSDDDAVGDVLDDDDDNDGFSDEIDVFALNPQEWRDNDFDGIGDNADLFDDDARVAFDLDGDLIGDFLDTDIDNDGIDNNSDVFDEDPTVWRDGDHDGIGNAIDNDLDNDGIVNHLDLHPTDGDRPIYTFNAFLPSASILPRDFTVPSESNGRWTVARDQAHSGASLGTLPLRDGRDAILEYGRFLSMPSVFSFWYKVESEPINDVFEFYLDDQLIFTDSGIKDWQRFEMLIPPGDHTYRWRYAKNDTISAPNDAAWIDTLTWQLQSDIAVNITDHQRQVVADENRFEHVIEVANVSDETAHFFLGILENSEFRNFQWLCFPSGGAECPMSGIGNIQGSHSLAPGQRLNYLLEGEVQNRNTSYELRAFATYNSGIVDLALENNLATREFSTVIFEDSFE